MAAQDEDILVVDDEQNIRLMLRSTLEADGFSVREASTGEEAIEAIEQTSPALVLLDLWMPQSNGMQVLEYLNQKPPADRPRVIVLTAHGRIPVVVKAMRLGASDFLEKPTTPEDLRLSVASALEDPRLEQEEPGAPASQGADEGPHRTEKLSPILMRIRQSVWNQDIHITEQVLSGLFRKAWSDPSWFNLLGAVFESEGNRGAARTFYQKAANSAAGSELALINLRRLDELDAGVEEVAEVELGEQEELLRELCASREVRSNREPMLNEGSRK